LPFAKLSDRLSVVEREKEVSLLYPFAFDEMNPYENACEFGLDFDRLLGAEGPDVIDGFKEGSGLYLADFDRHGSRGSVRWSFLGLAPWEKKEERKNKKPYSIVLHSADFF
jgi:hypothetical protein